MLSRLLLGVAAAIAAVLISAPGPAAAAAVESGWTVTSFAADLTVKGDGSLAVTETIDVNFGSLSKHGIYRDIPVRYSYSSTYDRTLDLSGWSVRDGGGRTVPYTLSTRGAYQELKIGDPNRTVSGHQTYVVRYVARGTFNGFSDHDELYWNATGDQWAVPIERATAALHAPSGSLQRVTCYEGAAGSTDPCASSLSGGSDATFAATRALAQADGLTVVAALAKGTVPEPKPILVQRPRDLGGMFSLTLTDLLGFGIVLGAGIGALAWLYWRAGRDRAYRTVYYLNHDPATPDEILPIGEHRPVVVEFGPPDNLRPAQLGVILDERADTRDLTASIIDLAARGYLRIVELPGHGLLGRSDYRIDQAQPIPDLAKLNPFERTLYYGLFPQARASIELSKLKGTFAPTLRDAEVQLLDDAMARKWFPHRPTWVRLGWRVAGLATIGAGILVAVVVGQLTGDGLVGIALALVGAALTLLAAWMPARTAVGHDLLYRTLGFRLYMTTAERYQQQFAEREKIFTSLLPYAIVFGCVDRWAHAFQDIDMQAAVRDWYVGPNVFNALVFSTALQGFASAVDTALPSVPASTGASGFGGGGFSGGGFGGGGGGSW